MVAQYTITTTDEQDAGLTWAREQSASATNQEYLDAVLVNAFASYVQQSGQLLFDKLITAVREGDEDAKAALEAAVAAIDAKDGGALVEAKGGQVVTL